MSVFFSGSRGDGQQRRVTVSAGDWEDQEPVVPQSDAGREHREEAQPQQQEWGTGPKANNADWTNEVFFSRASLESLPSRNECAGNFCF